MEKEFKNGKYGFYEILFECPKNIVVPVLLRKTENGGLEWSLLDGHGTYTNIIDIEHALQSGYQITFKNKALIWDKTGKVFTKYVDKYYKMKEDAEKENNDVKRSIAKLLLNAMYGKTLQIINNYNELLDFYKDYDMSQILISWEMIIKALKF